MLLLISYDSYDNLRSAVMRSTAFLTIIDDCGSMTRGYISRLVSIFDFEFLIENLPRAYSRVTRAFDGAQPSLHPGVSYLHCAHLESRRESLFHNPIHVER